MKEINTLLGLVGYSALVIALVFCALTLLLMLVVLRKKPLKIPAVFLYTIQGLPILLAVALVALGWLLLKNAFEYPLVFKAVELGMPWYYKLSGLWFGQASSLLFWSFILSTITAIATIIANQHQRGRQAAIIALLLTLGLVFFLAPVVFAANPFERLWQTSGGSMVEAMFAPAGSSLIVPLDGQGMNPNLRHPAMLLHPPALYLGLIGFFIPFAFAFGALACSDNENKWIKLAYPWVIFAWICLTAGMFLGSWWAYTILGWGGYWGWDAVEIAGLLPWLLSFGLIHSMQMQLKGRNFLRWIYWLSGLIVFFILTGILITRSGILESVHAYSTGLMGIVLSVLILLNMVPYFFFYFKHKAHFNNRSEKQKPEISETLARILNNLLILLVLIYFIGQTFPLTSQFFTGKQSNWSTENYEKASSPVLLAVLVITALYALLEKRPDKHPINFTTFSLSAILAAILPIYLFFTINVSLYTILAFYITGFLLIAWFIRLVYSQFSRQKLVSKFFSLGMVLIHLGLGFTALGILGNESLSRQADISIEVDKKVELDGLALIGQSRTTNISKTRTEVYTLVVLLNEVGSNQSFSLSPVMEYYPKMKMVNAIPAISSTTIRDIQLIIGEWEEASGSGARLRVNIHPLMLWLWIGGVCMCLGGVIFLIAVIKLHSSLKNRSQNKIIKRI